MKVIPYKLDKGHYNCHSTGITILEAESRKEAQKAFALFLSEQYLLRGTAINIVVTNLDEEIRAVNSVADKSSTERKE